jgi:hypothetical protein
MRWLAALVWVGIALGATALLGVVAVTAGPIPEWGHLVGHVVLCGGLAAMLAWRGSSIGSALVALAGAEAFGLAIEIVQLRVVRFSSDTLFDLGMDAFGACLGVAAVGTVRRDAAPDLGHALSVALHPLVVAPIGVLAVVYAAQRSVGAAILWTGAAVVCLLPAVGLWVAGVAGGWWTDADLSPRAERAPLFVAGCAGALAFAALAYVGPGPVAALAAVTLLGALLGAALTRAGLKVSGHVAIPVALALLLAPFSVRGPIPLLGVAVVLSWARLASGRHRAIEVAAAWLLAASCAGAALA